MLTAAALITVGAAGAAAAGAAGTTYGVYRHKKKAKLAAKRHQDTLFNMADQWAQQRSDDIVDVALYPRARSPIDTATAVPLSGIVSFGMGWDDETNLDNIKEVQMFAGAFAKSGELLSTFHLDNKSSNVRGIRHTGYQQSPDPNRTYSGMPDKQNIVVNLDEVEEASHILVGTIITSQSNIVDAYVTLYKGTDILDPASDNDQAVARFYLDSTECGVCNAYIMGILSRQENGWVFNPIRAPFSGKDTTDVVTRMQLYVAPKVSDIVFDETKIGFTNESGEEIQTYWYAFDRFGYVRSYKEHDFNRGLVELSDFITCDSISKIVIVTKQIEPSPIAVEVISPEGQQVLKISDATMQIACIITAHELHLNVPFPVVPDLPRWTLCSTSVALKCAATQEIFLTEIKKRFVPFTANCVLVSVISGSDLRVLSSKELKSPRESLSDSKKKRKPVDAYVKVSLNKESKKTKVIKKEENPVWEEGFSFPLDSDYFHQESTVNFLAKDKGAKKEIGECAYCIKSLRLPFAGPLTLSTKVSTLMVAINAVEKVE